MFEDNHSKGWRRIGRHYLLLLWKNLILTKRMPIRTFLEIILPVFFGFLLLGIRRIVKSDMVHNSTIYRRYSFNQLPIFTTDQTPSTIAYAPQTKFTNAIMQRVTTKLNLLSKIHQEFDVKIKIYLFQSMVLLMKID